MSKHTNGAHNLVVGAILALILASVVLSGWAGTVVQRIGDTLGTSFFTGDTNWNPTGIPIAGKDDFSSYSLRTPNDTAAYKLAGDWHRTPKWLLESSLGEYQAAEYRFPKSKPMMLQYPFLLRHGRV